MNFIEFQSCPPETILLMVVTVLLLLVSGMMSASEVAYFSLQPADIRQLRRFCALGISNTIKAGIASFERENREIIVGEAHVLIG